MGFLRLVMVRLLCWVCRMNVNGKFFVRWFCRMLCWLVMNVFLVMCVVMNIVKCCVS